GFPRVFSVHPNTRAGGVAAHSDLGNRNQRGGQGHATARDSFHGALLPHVAVFRVYHDVCARKQVGGTKWSDPRGIVEPVNLYLGALGLRSQGQFNLWTWAASLVPGRSVTGKTPQVARDGGISCPRRCVPT